MITGRGTVPRNTTERGATNWDEKEGVNHTGHHNRTYLECRLSPKSAPNSAPPHKTTWDPRRGVEESKTKQKHDVTKPCTQCVLFHWLDNLSQQRQKMCNTDTARTGGKQRKREKQRNDSAPAVTSGHPAALRNGEACTDSWRWSRRTSGWLREVCMMLETCVRVSTRIQGEIRPGIQFHKTQTTEKPLNKENNMSNIIYSLLLRRDFLIWGRLCQDLGVVIFVTAPRGRQS